VKTSLDLIPVLLRQSLNAARVSKSVFMSRIYRMRCRAGDMDLINHLSNPHTVIPSTVAAKLRVR